MAIADAWSDLADQVVALGDPDQADDVLDALVLLGMTGEEKASLTALIAGREDPAGLLLRRLLDEVGASTDEVYAVRYPSAYTDRDMDAAMGLSTELLRIPPEALATRLETTNPAYLTALPPESAGTFVVDVLGRAGAIGDRTARHKAMVQIGLVGRWLRLDRMPVARVLSVAVTAPDADDAVGELLLLTPAARIVAGTARAMRDGADVVPTLDLLAEVAVQRRSAAGSVRQGLPTDPTRWPTTGERTQQEQQQQQQEQQQQEQQAVPRDTELHWRGGGSGSRDLAPEATPQPAPEPATEEPEATRTAYPLLKVDSHLSAARPEVVVVETAFDVTVGLGKRKDVELTQTGRLAFTPGRTTELEVVLVYDPGSLTPQGDTHFTLQVSDAAPYPTQTVQFVAEWGPDDDPLPPERRIGVHYLVGGQLVGIAWRSLVVVDAAAKVDTAPQVSTREPALLDLDTLLGEDLPDLIVTICSSDSRNAGQFVWTAYSGASGVSVPDGPRTAQLDGDLQAFVVEIRRAVQFSKGGADDYLDLAGRAVRIGRAVPAPVAKAIADVITAPSRTTAPAILLLTEELSLPWELAMLPLATPLTTAWGGVSPFVGAHAAIGRWPLSEHKPRPTPRPSVMVRKAAVLTADYQGVQGWGKLDHALSEASDVSGLFTPAATAVRPALWDVVDLLKGTPPADVVHVALHGQFDAAGAQEGLVLLDTDASGQPTAKWRFLTPVEIETGNLGSGPFVFLNACQVASDKRVLGDYGGFASTLLRIGASGVVAPLWNVDDDVAATIAESFYAATWSAAQGTKVSAAEAIRAVRATYTEAAVRAQTPGITATRVAFQVYGHPRLQLTSAS